MNVLHALLSGHLKNLLERGGVIGETNPPSITAAAAAEEWHPQSQYHRVQIQQQPSSSHLQRQAQNVEQRAEDHPLMRHGHLKEESFYGVDTSSGRTRTLSEDKGDRILPLQKAPKRKKYTDRTPSNHCHICSRSVGAVKMAVCGNRKKGLCRKVICKLCCESFDLGWERFEMDKEWLCTHCENRCPMRARCHTYNKTNMRRKMASLSNRRDESRNVP